MKTIKMLVIFASVLALGLATQVANADFIFGKPQNLGPAVNSPSLDGCPSISADGLTLYFTSDRSGGLGYEDIWITTRSAVSEPWGPPVNLGAPVNSQFREVYPSISADGLELYFSDFWAGPPYRTGGIGGRDLWMTKRESPNHPWGPPVDLGPAVNSPADDWGPIVSNDGRTLVFASSRTGGRGDFDLWMCTRTSTQVEWGPAVNLGPTVNSTSFDVSGSLSSDGLVLFFESTRPGGVGSYDVWVTARKSIKDPWISPVNLGSAINTAATDGAPMISADMRMLYFTSNRSGSLGNYDLWCVSIAPVRLLPDFDGDRLVNLKDLALLAQHWGENESQFDISPPPNGDGVVSSKDLAGFVGYWLKEFGLLAHWTLDEIEGTIANDGVGDKDGTLNGNPIWQPQNGKVAGALQLDGVDDYVSTPFVLDPAAGAFSVFAWVKGGGAEQAIISQAGGVNWLAAGTSQGKLMTELKAAGRYGTLLFSETVIIDGEWHRVGLTWDGSTRTLFVDNVEVIKGTQGTLTGSTGSLYIGAGKNLEAGSFWSGLIDDVRIYDRAVKP